MRKLSRLSTAGIRVALESCVATYTKIILIAAGLTVLPQLALSAGGARGDANIQGPANEPKPEISRIEAGKATAPATQQATQSGSTIGQAARADNGGMGAPQRAAVNGATAAAMGQSAYIDSLYTSGQINKEDWLKLKAAMTQSMMGQVKKAAQGDTPLRSMNEPNAPQKSSAPPLASIPTPSEEEPLSYVPTPDSVGPSRTPSSIPPVADPFVAGADEQVLDLQSGGSTVFISAGGVDNRPTDSLKTTFNENARGTEPETRHDAKAITGQALVNGAGEKDQVEDAVTNYEKAALLAQKLLQEHKTKMVAKGAKGGKQDSTDNAESFRRAHARAMLSLQGLKKVSRVQESGEDGLRPPIQFSPEQVVSAVTAGRSPSSVINSPWDKKDSAFADENGLSNISLLFMALLGLFAGLATAYTLFMRPQKALVQLMVPGSGEHFTIRAGKKDGEFILDIMDVRGKLVRTAGTLRPESVARAAVLPPELAARLGAKGPFDRFEFREGEFVRTEKEEGYQVFPFEL